LGKDAAKRTNCKQHAQAVEKRVVILLHKGDVF
jgi:hypothetical protein